MPTYINGNYLVTILQDGTKIRRCAYNEFKPSFAENCDVKITDKCSQGCKFCYEGCTKDGKHADLFKYKALLESLHPYTEFAINGNDLDHPGLIEFLEFLRSKRVFTNITVNQNQFLSKLDKIKSLQERKLIYGVGVSLIKPTKKLIEGLKYISNTVLHTIIGILCEDDIEFLKNHNLKLLLLGYKNMSRGISYFKENNKIIEKNKQYLQDNLENIIKTFDVVSFDNLALSQLNVKSLLSEEEWEKFYMGDDGSFTFYLDLVKGKFSKNSISKERYEIENKTIDEIFKYLQNESRNINED